MNSGTIDEKWLKKNKNSPQVFVWDLPEIPSHPLFLKARGQVIG
jgi:hypothetical protein